MRVLAAACGCLRVYAGGGGGSVRRACSARSAPRDAATVTPTDAAAATTGRSYSHQPPRPDDSLDDKQVPRLPVGRQSAHKASRTPWRATRSPASGTRMASGTGRSYSLAPPPGAGERCPLRRQHSAGPAAPSTSASTLAADHDGYQVL